MKNWNRLLALALCFLMIVSIAIPAFATGDSTVPEGEVIELPETTPVPEQTEAPVETTVPEQKVEPVVDLNAELYAKLMAAQSEAEWIDIARNLNEEEQKTFIEYMSEEQVAELQNHVNSITVYEKPVTKNFTNAGPFMPPVEVKSVQRMIRMMSSGTDAGNGLEIGKNAVANGDGSYTITMDAYTTGTVVTETKTSPVDIVLVLDQSGSMAYGFDGNSTNNNSARRQYAMKNAVNGFIDAVAEKYNADNSDHRIAIVTFGSGATRLQNWIAVDETGKTTLKDRINKLPDSPSGATNIGAGMQEAKELMGDDYNYSGKNINRQKVVIAFTDGMPTNGDEFSVDVANIAIDNAKALKDEGVTIYTIGIFGGANADQLHDNSVDGDVGDSWDGNRFLFWGDLTQAAVPACNRFMNYLSSNFLSADEVGLKRESFNILIYASEEFTITKNFERDKSGYYLTASDSSSLNNIFTTISTNIETAKIELGSTTIVKDTVSEYFALPEGADADDIKLYVAPAAADGSFGERTAAPATVVATVNGSEVSVTGFDFNVNMVTDKVKTDGTYGKKLIIEFTVVPKAGFVGGNDVPTNNPNASGVYRPNTSVPVEAFGTDETTPKVNVPIQAPEFTVNNKTIYYGNSLEVASLYTLSSDNADNAWAYRFVNVSVSGVNGETVNPEDCTNYTVAVTYAPKTSGENADGTPATAKSSEKTVSVHVLQPTVTATVNDVTAIYGEAYTLGQGVDGKIEVAWTDKHSHSGIPAAVGDKPYTASDLTLAYASEGFNGTVPKKDFDVNVKVLKGETEMPATITTTCGTCDTATDGKYTVHVTTGTLTIAKTGGADDEPYVFTVYKDGTAYTQATIVGNGYVEIKELPVGTYTIEEDTNWSWRYDAAYSAGVTISATAPTGTLTCTNESTTSQWLNGFSTVVKNIFGAESPAPAN